LSTTTEEEEEEEMTRTSKKRGRPSKKSESKMCKVQFGSTLDVGGRSFVVGGEDGLQDVDLASDGEEEVQSLSEEEEGDANDQMSRKDPRSLKIEYENYHEQVLSVELRKHLIGTPPPPPVQASPAIDTRLVCQDGVLGCSGLLLAMASPMLMQSLNETGAPGEVKTIVLPGVSREDIQFFLG